MALVNADDWESFYSSHPEAHILQSAAWGELKSGFGWQPERICTGGSGAQVLFRRLPLGLSLAYIPKGPVGMDWNAVITAVEQLCRRKRAILLKVEPDAWENEDVGERLIGLGFRSDGVPVQPRRTIVVDLSGSETDWMGRMRQKTRYNIRLAERKEVQVHSSSQVQVFHELMQTTGQRDGFGVHSLEYYRQAYELFHPAGMVELFLAEYASRPLAGLMVFSHGKRAWYLYGASNDEERNRMPAYLLQWEAMRWATQRGCTQYDLWGVPDAGEEDLEAQFERRSDGLWGVYRFKRGFGGVLRRAAPTYEKALNLPLFWLYRIWARQRAVE